MRILTNWLQTDGQTDSHSTGPRVVEFLMTLGSRCRIFNKRLMMIYVHYNRFSILLAPDLLDPEALIPLCA